MGRPGRAQNLMHPSDMILEQSNDDDDSFVDRRPRRGIDLLGEAERTNVSIVEDDYVIVDPITESFRNKNGSDKNRRSFFEESLISIEKTSQMQSPANLNDDGQMSSPEINVHISQLDAGLTSCSEDEEEEEEEEEGPDHFKLEGTVTEAEDN
jgi:hypothetical protein